MLAGRHLIYGSIISAALLHAVQAHAQEPVATEDAATPTSETAPSPVTAPEAGRTVSDEEIVVTARRRDEGLISVPVAVSVMTSGDLARNNATDLARIGELTPTVIIANYRSNSGGSIAIRGVSSSANQLGFEQAVSVAIDGVQTSNGRIATLGFFDIRQVEVLKGPQALFFGRNSPAGVISVSTASPTDHFEARIAGGYEFVGDEGSIEGYISGPITDTLRARLAVKYRHMTGWLYNDARSIADPFYTAAQPPEAAVIPDPAKGRVGDEDLLGRLTVQFEPTENFAMTFKAFASHGRDQGNGASAQNIGPCTGPNPRAFGIADPFGECRIDNHVSLGSLSSAVTSTSPRGPRDGQSYGKTDAVLLTLNTSWDTGWAKLAATTGFSRIRADSASSLDYTVFSGLYKIDSAIARSFSQELRLLSDFDGPVNFMAGAYYQNTRDSLYDDFWALRNTIYNPAANRYSLAERNGYISGRAYSAFGQLIWNVTPEVEFAGGLRFTSEKKRTSQANIYGRSSSLGNYDTLNFVYPSSLDQTPGVLAGKFSDDNLSPEVTLTWHPQSNATLYLAYRTGFKSGGFGISSALSRATTLGDIDFDSETVKGFEAGAKGDFLDRRLRITSSLFAYNFSNLQVNSFDAVNVRYVINNAGSLRQRGADIELTYQASPALRLRSALSYVHNRFRNYIGQCYAFPIPAAAAQTTPAPPGCSFRLNTDGSRALAGNGTPILEQVFSGRAPARSPDWSGNAGFDVTAPVGKLDLRFSGDAYYSGKYFASETMAPSTLQKDFWRLNASLALGSSSDGWEVSLVGRNLTNKYYLSYAADRTGGTSIPLAIGEQRGVVARGREVAIQASIKF